MRICDKYQNLKTWNNFFKENNISKENETLSRMTLIHYYHITFYYVTYPWEKVLNFQNPELLKFNFLNLQDANKNE